MTRRLHLLGLASLAFTIATPALVSSAWAQTPASRAGDGWQILSAQYGTAERNVDVTQRLRELARNDDRFRMGNDIFGVDPHPGRVKTLRIVARGRDGQQSTFEYAEGSIVDGRQFEGWRGGNWGGQGNQGGQGGQGRRGDDGEFVILQARYGTAERYADVTQRLQQMARRDREFRLGNNSFNLDPHPGRVKSLVILARGRDGRPRTFEYAEGSVIDGSQFRGWSSGNWGGSGGNGQAGQNRPQRLTIVNARYGAGQRQIDVTQSLRNQLQGGQLDLRVDNNLIGGRDPMPGRAKELRVVYTLGNGRQQTLRIAEGERLQLP